MSSLFRMDTAIAPPSKSIGVVNHCKTVVEPPEYVARLIRKALEHIPPERLVITTDCGFGREGWPSHARAAP
jgi:methionine synthase II (cobalamin-independent)